jgi:hypothetical protein
VIRSGIAALGRLALFLAGAAFLAALSLLVLGSWLVAFPILRKSPRERRRRAAVDLASNALQLLMTFQGSMAERAAQAAEYAGQAPGEAAGPDASDRA